MSQYKIESVLTPIEEQAVILVHKCFGSISDEMLAFVKYLVTVEHGLPWDDEPIPDCAWLHAQAEGRPIPPDVAARFASQTQPARPDL